LIKPEDLQQYALFGGLRPEQMASILPHMETAGYAAGEEIITEGTTNDKIRFILEGRVEVTKKGIHIAELGEGDAFGEMEVLDVMPSIATIRVLEPTKVMSISNKTLHEIYKNDVNGFSLIIMNLARDLSRRLRKMDDREVEEAYGNKN
jgi:CRP-like cAMP-binding protein